jgi:hypothetical protein
MDAMSVDTGHWQSLKNVPHTATRELQNVVIETPIPQGQEDAALWVEPNLPWAEDHFQERVGGEPTNPGSQYFNWPWYDPGWKAQRKEEGKPNIFSHTYQERMWPRYAPQGDRSPLQTQSRLVAGENFGVRYRYGDLQDVVNLLAREPTTRQAYLPIWFPEDTGAHHGERVPCTLGYHFVLRQGLLHVTYFIRSCDFLRYFRDDVYMAMRLGQWILGELNGSNKDQDSYEDWTNVDMGILHMHMVSLHIFEGDMGKMRREAPPTP